MEVPVLRHRKYREVLQQLRQTCTGSRVDLRLRSGEQWKILQQLWKAAPIRKIAAYDSKRRGCVPCLFVLESFE